MKRLACLLLFALCCASAQSLTTINGPLLSPINGAPLTGSCTVSTPLTPVTTAGASYGVDKQTFAIFGGLFSVQLVPNDVMTPAGTSYAVRCTSAATGTWWTETWYVRSSPTPLTIGAVRVAGSVSPSIFLSVAQLSPSGAANGNVLQFNGVSWAPATISVVGGTADWNTLLNKPSFATVATSGSYTDLSSKPTIPAAQVNSDWSAVSGLAQILNKPATWAWASLSGVPSFATVATSGSYTDLSSKPTIPAAQVNSDWSAVSGLAQILNKPATWAWASLSGVPSFATVATSGSYTDLGSKPTLGTAAALNVGTGASNIVQLNGSMQLPAVSAALLTNWPTLNQATTGTAAGLTAQYIDWSAGSGGASIKNKPTLAANTTAVTHQFFAAYNSTTGAFTQAQPAAADISGLATVATSGSYTDLSSKPTASSLGAEQTANKAVASGYAGLDGTGTVPPAQGGVGTMSGAPMWLRYTGTGADGASNCSGNLAGGEYWYTTFTVSLGNTCTSNVANVPLIIRATGACTIAGTLQARGQDGGIVSTGDVGGTGAGGGGGAGTGGAGLGDAYTQSTSGLSMTAGGTAGTSSGGTGGNGNAPSNGRYVRKYLSMGTTLPWGGSVGGVGGSSGGAVGPGGQALLLVCGSINFTGLASVAGGNGGPATANSTGGGGGGGGGYAIFSTPTYTANTGEIAASGGTGGACINPAVVFGLPATPQAGVLSGAGALAHVSTFAAGNPTGITVDAAGSGFNYTPTASLVGTGGGANSGSGATLAVTMAGVSPNMTVASIAVSGGNGGYGTGTTYTTCGRGGDGGAGWAATLTMQ